MLASVDKKCIYSRQLKKKKMTDILNPSPQKALGEVGRQPQPAEGVACGEMNEAGGCDTTYTEESFSDSIIERRNRILCETHLQGEPGNPLMSLEQIWDLLTKIEVDGFGRDDEMIKRISKLESRDATMFAE
ncbi:hypothetical protein Ancab_028343, partial [Ancistrocladus abbreviatus]